MRWTYRAETLASAELRSLAGTQNWRCAYCGEIMLDIVGRPNSATRDHVVSRKSAKKRPGFNVDGWWNLVAACCGCNTAKGARDAYEFFNQTQRQLRRLARQGPTNHDDL